MHSKCSVNYGEVKGGGGNAPPGFRGHSGPQYTHTLGTARQGSWGLAFSPLWTHPPALAAWLLPCPGNLDPVRPTSLALPGLCTAEGFPLERSPPPTPAFLLLGQSALVPRDRVLRLRTCGPSGWASGEVNRWIRGQVAAEGPGCCRGRRAESTTRVGSKGRGRWAAGGTAGGRGVGSRLHPTALVPVFSPFRPDRAAPRPPPTARAGALPVLAPPGLPVL